VEPTDDDGLDEWLLALGARARSAAWPVQRHQYARHSDAWADLRLPSAPGRHPLVVLIHGGYFLDEYKKDIQDPIADDLPRRGFASWNIEYRRSGGGSLREAMTDVQSAVQYVSSLKNLGIRQLIVVGHSAGGYLALWSATLPGVTAVVGLAPVTDLVAAARGGHDGGAVAEFMGGSPDAAPRAYEAASLLRRPKAAHQIIIHGTADRVVPASLSRQYVADAARDGTRVELIELANEGHYGFLDPMSGNWRCVVNRLRHLAGVTLVE